MKKIIDISAYQGIIDWKVASAEVGHVILRTTTQNGKIDGRFMENLNGAVANSIDRVDGYKFAYTRDYISAFVEASKCLDTLEKHGALRWLYCFWLDLEGHGGSDYTTAEANAVIKGYKDAAHDFGVRFGLYFNYNYAKNIVDEYWGYLPLWIARYNKTLGDVSPWAPIMWQYTDKGNVTGIKGYVDVSRGIE